MTHRIREAMKSGNLGQLGGSGKIVEADETYFGMEGDTGKKNTRSKYRNKRKIGGELFNSMNKIVSLVERNGAVRSFHVADFTGKNLKDVLVSQVKRDTRLMTDASPRYNEVKRAAPFISHETVNHSAGEYVRGDVTTNGVEGYFSILKRGLIGTYHHVASVYLQRYVNEFDFRYNHREALGYSGAQRANAMLKEIGGKRLTYRA